MLYVSGMLVIGIIMLIVVLADKQSMRNNSDKELALLAIISTVLILLSWVGVLFMSTYIGMWYVSKEME